MRLAAATLALLMAAPAVAQTPLTGTSGQPTQQTGPLSGTTPGTTPGATPNATPGATAGQNLPSTPARPARRRATLAQRFDAANTTHDGHLTLQQAKDGRMNAVARDFATIDADHKGYVTLDEVRANNRARRTARRAAPQ